MTILQISAFAAKTAGNFIPSLLALQHKNEELGHTTIYAFPQRAKDQDWCKELEQSNKVYYLPEKHARILPTTYKTIKSIIKSNKVDIVHSHFELYDIPTKVVCKNNTRVFWHLHDTIEDNYNKSKFSRKLLYKLQYGFFKKRVKLLTVSERHSNFAVKLGFDKDSVIYVPNAIDKSRLNFIEDAKYDKHFLMFGWDVYRKGVDLAINAANSIDNISFPFLIIGQEDSKRYVEQYSSNPNVMHSFPTEKVDLLYASARAFLHVSRAEGFSYALLEAIYSGTPVICSDIPENQFAREFEGIIWIKNGDAQALKEALDLILESNYKNSPDIIKRNRQLIEKKYSLNSWCEQISSIYYE